MKITQIKNRVYFATIAIILTLSNCIPKKNTQAKKIAINQASQTKKSSNNPITNQKEKHTVTIWIHGTRSVGVQDYIFKDFFYRKIGLHKADQYQDKHNLKKIATIMSNEDTPRFTFENFYFFGWSGELSHKKRKEAAQKLHKALLSLVETYRAEYGVIPQIRFITHSHGGNVALNFAKINDKALNKIPIAEFIPLACPVQKKTAKYIASNTFDRIYSLFSGLDLLQVIDPQGLHDLKKTIKKRGKKPFFSKRVFKPQPNLNQVKIKINGRGILHIEFLTVKFIQLLPHILKEIDRWEQEEIHYPQAHKAVKLLKISIKNDAVQFERKKLKTRYAKHSTNS